MTKKEVINKLLEMNCDIAEVICDISVSGQVVYPDESIVVSLVEQPCNDDLVNPSKHWTWCESIKDFKEGIVSGLSAARRAYCKHYVSNFKEVREFKGDY
jgi:hypothetical protein